MAEIDLERIAREILVVKIKGTAPLIVNRFSEKARQQMLDAQTGGPRLRKAPKNVEDNFQRSLHRLPDGRCGFPASGFKGAMVAAARYFDSITMTGLKTMVWVHGEGPEQLVPIVGEVRMREDPVKNASGVADLRHRGEFAQWEAELRVGFLPHMLTVGSVLSLVDAAGMCGIGEWRPTAPKNMTGSYGTWEVIDQ